eukprot:scaffold290866_cov21-Tisochrysis_lutea.AAC.1
MVPRALGKSTPSGPSESGHLGFHGTRPLVMTRTRYEGKLSSAVASPSLTEKLPAALVNVKLAGALYAGSVRTGWGGLPTVRLAHPPRSCSARVSPPLAISRTASEAVHEGRGSPLWPSLPMAPTMRARESFWRWSTSRRYHPSKKEAPLVGGWGLKGEGAQRGQASSQSPTRE